MSNDARANLVSTDALLLARYDRDAAETARQVAHEIRRTAAPWHPSSDPVSRDLVEGLIAVLRGPGGLENRLVKTEDELKTHAAKLEAVERTYRETDLEIATRLTAFGEHLEGR